MGLAVVSSSVQLLLVSGRDVDVSLFLPLAQSFGSSPFFANDCVHNWGSKLLTSLQYPPTMDKPDGKHASKQNITMAPIQPIAAR